MPLLPFVWKFCFIQKHAVELLSNPRRATWSSSVASAGNLIIGADCLNTLPPRSSTKWLWVATKENAIERGCRNLSNDTCAYSYHVKPRSRCVFLNHVLFHRLVRKGQR